MESREPSEDLTQEQFDELMASAETLHQKVSIAKLKVLGNPERVKSLEQLAKRYEEGYFSHSSNG